MKTLAQAITTGGRFADPSATTFGSFTFSPLYGEIFLTANPETHVELSSRQRLFLAEVAAGRGSHEEIFRVLCHAAKQPERIPMPSALGRLAYKIRCLLGRLQADGGQYLIGEHSKGWRLANEPGSSVHFGSPRGAARKVTAKLYGIRREFQGQS